MGQSHRKEKDATRAELKIEPKIETEAIESSDEKNSSDEQDDQDNVEPNAAEKEKKEKMLKEIESFKNVKVKKKKSKSKRKSTRNKAHQEAINERREKDEKSSDSSGLPQLPPLNEYYPTYSFNEVGLRRVCTTPKELRMSMSVQTGFRALVVGDLHLRDTRMDIVRKTTTLLRNLIRELKTTNVFLLGDIFHSLSKVEYADFVFGTLKTLAMDDVKYYYVSGNHERWFLNQFATRFAQELTRYNITLITSYLVELKPQIKEHDHFFVAHDCGAALRLKCNEIQPFILKTKALNVPQSDYLIMAHVHRQDDFYFNLYRCGSVATFSSLNKFSHGVINYTEKGFSFEFKTLSAEKVKEYSKDVE